MNFVLLGSDPACLPLIEAIGRAPRHALAAVAHADDHWPEISRSVPTARQVSGWQQLLVEPDVGAVIVAGHSAEVLEGARTLAREGRTLVVFPDIRQSSSFAYDLWPMEDDGRSRLIPLFEHEATHDRAVVHAKLHDTGVGAIQFVQLERTFPPRDDGLLPLAAVENALLHDADLLRRVCGDYDRVTCVPVGMKSDRVAMMTVTLTGDDLPETTWRVSTATGAPTARLTVSGQAGSLVHDLSANSTSESADAGRIGHDDAALCHVEEALDGDHNRSRWSSVVRAFDVVDAARRSVRRRRTVEIGSEAISEQRQFKSLMTAAGCGVLLYTMFGVVAALLIGVAADPRDAAQKRSTAAGFVLDNDDFAPGGAELTANGQARVADIAARLWTTTADVIIEASPPDDSHAVDAQRSAVVEQALGAAGAANTSGRVVTRPLTGQWFERLMIGVWVVVFAPLVLVLATQLLGFAARPDR